MPVTFMMGIPYEESFTVAELIGEKLFINEFVAYEHLSKLKRNRLGGLEEVIEGERMWISVSKLLRFVFNICVNLFIFNMVCLFQIRSEIITTYALCGFANFSSLGITIGGLCEYYTTAFFFLFIYFFLS